MRALHATAGHRLMDGMTSCGSRDDGHARRNEIRLLGGTRRRRSARPRREVGSPFSRRPRPDRDRRVLATPRRNAGISRGDLHRRVGHGDEVIRPHEIRGGGRCLFGGVDQSVACRSVGCGDPQGGQDRRLLFRRGRCIRQRRAPWATGENSWRLGCTSSVRVCAIAASARLRISARLSGERRRAERRAWRRRAPRLAGSRPWRRSTRALSSQP